MVQSDIIVRKATLEDLEYKSSACLTVNQAYRSKGNSLPPLFFICHINLIY